MQTVGVVQGSNGEVALRHLLCEYGISDRGHSLVFEPQLDQGELIFVDTAKKLYAGNRDGGIGLTSKAKHQPGPTLSAAMILFDHVVQALGRSQLYMPGKHAIRLHLAYGSMRRKRRADCGQTWT